MYVNQIDTFVLNSLNEYSEYLKKDKLYNLLTTKKNLNYVEYNNQINDNIQNFIDKLKTNELEVIIKNKTSIIEIKEIVKRYIIFYIFLLIAFYYEDDEKKYINNLIQYTISQEKSTFKVKNFFNSENNQLVIKFFTIIRQSIYLMTLGDTERKQINKIKYNDTINFLNNIGSLLNSIYDKDTQKFNVHSLIIVIVFRLVYKEQEKKSIFDLLEKKEDDNEKYIYINVVRSKINNLSLMSFAKSMKLNNTLDDIDKAKTLFTMMHEENNIIEDPIIISNKLLSLNWIYPISDEFVRVNRDDEKDDMKILPILNKDADKNERGYENIKVQNILKKIDLASDLYNNPENETQIKNSVFYSGLYESKAIVYNNNSENNVINKYYKLGSIKQNNEAYLQLIEFNTYPYINFKNFKNIGFNTHFDKTVSMIRYVNIEFPKNKYYPIEMRTSREDSQANIVGISIPILHSKHIYNLTRGDLIDIRTLEFMDRNKNKYKSENGYDMAFNLLCHGIIDNLILNKNEIIIDNDEFLKLNPSLKNKVIYWIYDLNKDIIDEKNISLSISEKIINLNVSLYKNITKYLLENISKIITDKTNIFKIFSFLKTFFPKFDIIDKEYGDILNIYYNKLIKDKIEDKNDNEEIIKIPDIKIDKNHVYINPIIIDTTNPYNIKIKNILKIFSDKNEKLEYTKNTFCIHEKIYNQIKKINDINEYNNEIYKFMEEYSISIDGGYTCKICSAEIPINQYANDGKFNDTEQKYIPSGIRYQVNLNEQKDYKYHQDTILYLESLIMNFSLITNTNMFIGFKSFLKTKRTEFIKNVIDITFTHNNVLLIDDTSVEKNKIIISDKYNIKRDLLSILIYELNDKIYKEEKESVKYKKNTILLYFVLYYILEMTNTQLIIMSFDNVANLERYNTYSEKLFEKIEIITSSQDKKKITEYPILAYLIYMMSYLILKNKRWYFPTDDKNNKFNPIIFKSIINNLCYLLNSIIDKSFNEKDNLFYQLFAQKYFIQLGSFFNKKEIFEQMDKMQNKKIIKKEINKEEKIFENIKSYRYNDGIHIEVNNFETDIYEINEFTNCLDGQFHKWSKMNSKGEVEILNPLTCYNCNKKYTELKNKENKEITDKYYEGRLERYKKSLNCFKKEKDCIVKENNHDNIIKNEIISKDVSNKEFNFNNNIDGFINRLIGIIGKDVDLKLNNYPTYLDDDIYIIDHDHYGNNLKKNIIIKESEKKLIFKDNTVHYTNYLGTETDVYYDNKYLYLLGYREKYKNMIQAPNIKKNIKINKSLKTQLLQLTYNLTNIDITELKENLNELEIINNLTRNRVIRMKNIISEINIIIQEEINEKKIEYVDIFNDWSKIKNFLHSEKIEKTTINFDKVNNINFSIISENDKIGNKILYYLINELTKLLNGNVDKVKISKLIISIINKMYKLYNEEEDQQHEMARFIYLMNGSEFLSDLRIKGVTTIVEEEIDEIVENKENEDEDLEEETQALDVEEDELEDDDAYEDNNIADD